MKAIGYIYRYSEEENKGQKRRIKGFSFTGTPWHHIGLYQYYLTLKIVIQK